MSIIKKIINEFSKSKNEKKESSEFYQWLNSPFGADQKEEALNNLWNTIEVDAKLSTEKSYKKTCEKIDQKSTIRSKYNISRNIMKWAAVITLPLFVTLYSVYIQVNTSESQVIAWVEVYTKYGEKKTIILPDSSVVALNSGSKLIYPTEFKGSHRQVFLSGEGYATITKDKNKPFILSAGDINVEVLGTSFNVKSYLEDSEVEIALIEGSVLVTIPANNESLQLSPGEVVRYDKINSKITKGKFNKSNIGGDSMSFINSRFCDIISQLERNFNVQIIVTDKSILNDRYYAIFVNNEEVNQILESLNVSNSLKIERENDLIFIRKR